MSYARFGWGGSSVYVFADVEGGLTCCGCLLAPGYVVCETADRMDGHLQAHEQAGHTVPNREAMVAEMREDRF